MYFISFDLHRYTAHHQQHLVRLAGHILVRPSLQICKPPLYQIIAHAAAPYLVGHEYEGGILRGERVEFFLDGCQRLIHRRLVPFRIITVEEKIGTP